MALVVRAPSVSDELVAFTLIVVGVPVDLLHALVSHLLEELSLLLLLRAQVLHKLQTQVAFFVQNLSPFPFARINDVGFGAGERWTYHDLRPFEEACDVEMVAI